MIDVGAVDVSQVAEFVLKGLLVVAALIVLLVAAGAAIYWGGFILLTIVSVVLSPISVPLEAAYKKDTRLGVGCTAILAAAIALIVTGFLAGWLKW